MKNKKFNGISVWRIIIFIIILLVLCYFLGSPSMAKKPIIYLYPQEKTNISVKLGNADNITTIYPNYNNGWNVIAYSDGTLIDEKAGKEYYSLYYESKNIKKYGKKFEEGFVIEKENITSFLEKKLSLLGLNARESEEFIIYWLPKLQKYKYIYIRFQSMDEIEYNMPLDINPRPDTLIRIMMEWKGLNKHINVKEQVLTPVTRNGYIAVEWGGTEIK